jgi:hypothetical protein
VKQWQAKTKIAQKMHKKTESSMVRVEASQVKNMSANKSQEVTQATSAAREAVASKNKNCTECEQN